jgi:erythromycin esterase-like protein
MRRRAVAAALVALVSACASMVFATGGDPERRGAPAATDMDLVVRDVCGKSVAFLGEAPMHGYGKTIEFKVELVRRLIDECHYNAFLIESGTYDFLNIQKALSSGRPVTPAMLSAAIGGLWANREMEPLIPFLLEKAQQGIVTLGGLDDQLGRGTYAQLQMPADLVEYLPGEAKPRCLAVLQKHTLWQYTDDAPYGAQDHARIVDCLDRIGDGIATTSVREAPFRDLDLAAVASLKRLFARDVREGVPPGADVTQDLNDRDHSMFLNFRWWISTRKAIVWTATNHAAVDLSGVPGQERRTSLGAQVRETFKDTVFTLGFSAASGSYAMGRQPARALIDAPAASLEGRAFIGTDADTRYFTRRELRGLARIAARPLGATFTTAAWDRVLDGLIVFREERPPVAK